MSLAEMDASEEGDDGSSNVADSQPNANRSRSHSLPSVDQDSFSADATSPELEQALEEYYRRLDEGEQLDIEAYCARFPAHQSALRGLLAFDRFLGHNPNFVPELSQEKIAWPTVGEECGDLTLLRPLGSGAFARVFLAAEASTGGRRVAVKFSQGGAAEARTLGRLSHPHIVPILSARQEEATGLTMVCMPYLGSTTLENLLDRFPSRPDEPRPRKATIILDVLRACAQPEDPPAGTIDPHLQTGSYADGVIHLAVQMAEALAFLHAQLVCHRDLKPSNILLDPSGKALLLDFNLSTSERETDVPMGGSLGYAAPEQMHAFLDKQKGNLDKRADLYAFGVIVYRLLNGEHPYGPIPPDLAREPLARFLLDRLKLGFRPLRRVCPDLERPVAAVLDRCLAVNPADRPCAAELLAELKRQFSPLRCLRRRLAARPRTVAAAIGLFLLSITAAGFAWSEQSPSSEREYQQGEAAYHAGDYDEAEKHFDLAVQTESDNPRFRFARGCARLKQSKTLPPNQAKDKLDQAFADVNTTTNKLLDAPKWALQAYMYNREQNLRKAIRCYEQLGRTDYFPVLVLNNRAYTNLQLKSFQNARNDLNEAARLNPNCQAVFYNRALLAFYEQMDSPAKSSLPQQALNDIDRAIQLGPTTPALYREAALLYAQSLWQDRHHVPLYLQAPIVTALHFRVREQRTEQALAYLRQAIAEGQPPLSITKNPYFQQALGFHRSFAELQQIQPQRTVPPMELRLIDPIDLPH